MATGYFNRDSLMSFATLPRYSVLEGIPLEREDDVASVIPALEASEHSSVVVPPGYSDGIGPSSLTPRYTTVFGAQDEAGRSSTTGSVSPSKPRREHDFYLRNGKKAWATLNVLSSAPSTTNAPKFYGGDDIAGSFSLDLDSNQYIQTIKLTILGRIITSHNEDGSFTFLDESATLWSKAMGDPRVTMEQTRDKKFDGKLIGQYSWPFSFKFPTQATLSSGHFAAPHHVFQIPQSFREKETSATIQYDLVLHIGRGKLRADQRIQTPVIYVPKIVPDPPSIPRQLAYRDNSPLPGPGSDPDGWFTLPSTIIHGDIYERHGIPVEYNLSLARPLCYTRGTVIPRSLTIKCIDTQVLDLLSSPRAINVRLQRRIKYFQSNVRQAARRRSSTASAIQHDMEEIKITTAKWWSPPKDCLLDGDERRVEGELHLPRDLQPSSDFAHFVVEYSVDLVKFNCPVFVQVEPLEILASQIVAIATFPTSGPTPRAYTARQLPASRSSTFEKIPVEIMPGYPV